MQCESQYLPLNKYFDYKISKLSLATIVTVFDVFSIVCLIMAKNLMKYMQKDFSDIYDTQTVEARDFTVEIINFP